MSNVKINLILPDAPVTGKQVSFVAPCACTNVDCLVINNVNYTIVDAVGSNIAGTDSWVDGAVVSVILNVEDKKAYIQNPKVLTKEEVRKMISDYIGMPNAEEWSV